MRYIEPSKCTCEEEDNEMHSCPYVEEIHNDYAEDHCSCCAYCTNQCRWDI